MSNSIELEKERTPFASMSIPTQPISDEIRYTILKIFIVLILHYHMVYNYAIIFCDKCDF